MAQRSPNNARYQKHTKPTGSTRRSAASVKPKRDAGKTAAESSKSSKGGSASKKYLVPETPEYRKWRNVWWWLLGGSAGCALLYLAVDYLARRGIVALPAGDQDRASRGVLRVARHRDVRGLAEGTAGAPRGDARCGGGELGEEDEERLDGYVGVGAVVASATGRALRKGRLAIWRATRSL